MIEPQFLLRSLEKIGYDWFCGVPCSYLTSIIEIKQRQGKLLVAANEGDAAGIISGAYLGGRKIAFFSQNSGLTNAMSPLTSLIHTFKIPLFGLLTLRGEANDEPQHELMGEITTPILDSLKIQWQYLTEDEDLLNEQLNWVATNHNRGKTCFLIVRRGTIKSYTRDNKLNDIGFRTSFTSKFPESGARTNHRVKRLEILESIQRRVSMNSVVITTTGKTGREYYELGDQVNQFYNVGAMGCASSIGLGIAVTTKKKVVIIDGDGALLMRTGAMATIADKAPGNLIHILLDNYSHDSTGGQTTAGKYVNFPLLASAMGYTNIGYADKIEEFEKVLSESLAADKLTFIYVPIQKGSKPGLGRPSVKPAEVAKRLQQFLLDDTPLRSQ